MKIHHHRRYHSLEMCSGPLFGNIIRYTIPIILTGVLQLLFNAADLIVVGRFCGSVSVGAVGATGSIINLIVNLFIGLSVGAGVSVAHSIGAGIDSEVHRAVHTAIPTALISGVILTIIGVCFSGSLLKLMGTPSDVIGLSTVYMQIYFCGITASMVYNFGAAILRAAGDTKSPLIYLTLAGVLNVVLNVVFVVAFNLDVAGVALATTISQFFSAIMVLRALIRRQDACRLEFGKLRIYKRSLLEIMRIGVPAGIQGSLFSISNVIIQSSVNLFGSVAVSGNAAAANIEGFVYISMNSLHQTALNFTGQNSGAGRYDRVKRIMAICLLCVTVVGVVAGGLVFLFAEPLLSIYITDSKQALATGALRLSLICLPYFLCGIMEITTGVIRGMGSSIGPMIITVLGVCGLRIGWVYTVFQIPEYHTLESLYVSYPISWALAFTAQLILFFILIARRTKKQKLIAPD